MPISRTTRRVGHFATIAALACAFILSGLVSSAHADDGDGASDGIGITVDVVGPEATIVPSPPASDTPIIVTTPPSSFPTGGTVTETTVDDPADADEALGTDIVNLGGVLYVSGLTSTVSPAIGPGNGSVSLTMTVRNVSETAFDSDLRFWIDNAFGVRVAEVTNLTVADLKPGETRIVTATMRDLGQWTVLGGHVTLTPPDEVEGTELSALTRDTTFALAPLFLLLVVGGAAVFALAVALGWFLLRRAGFSAPFVLASLRARG